MGKILGIHGLMSDRIPIDREFAAEARLYHLCAEDADGRIGKLPAYQLAAPRPAMLLMAFSIELSLKSFLLSKGHEETDVRKHGHDLVSAWNCCAECGATDVVALSEKEFHLLEVISDLHSNLCLRYRKPSELGKLPVFGPFESISRKFLDLCDAPSLKEIAEEGF